METKKCSKCGEVKELNKENFEFRKSRGYFSTVCRLCSNVAKNVSRNRRNAKKTHKEKEEAKRNKAEYDKQYYIEHIDEKHAHNKRYYLDNKKSIREANDRYRKKNKDAVNAAKKRWKKAHPESVRISAQKYREKNKDKILKYQRTKRDNDIQFRLRNNLRSRLRAALKHNLKGGSAVRDLGCSIGKLVKYLEKQFYTNVETNEEMTWENYGIKGWHIDHIIPMSHFDLTKRSEIKKACHYTNLQPLWGKENISKGNKILEK